MNLKSLFCYRFLPRRIRFNSKYSHKLWLQRVPYSMNMYKGYALAWHGNLTDCLYVPLACQRVKFNLEKLSFHWV